jgi:hypothetical protein
MRVIVREPRSPALTRISKNVLVVKQRDDRILVIKTV